MSERPINLRADLKRLQDEGYSIEIKKGYLILRGVKYVTKQGEIAEAMLVSDFDGDLEKVTKPGNHQVWFTGEFPCGKDGRPIEALRHTDQQQTLFDDLTIKHRFSCKPPGGYADYYEKMTRYNEIVNNPALSIDNAATSKLFLPIVNEEDEVFVYADTASSRYGITALSEKCAMARVAIIGLGGTGAYVLDMIAKTPVKEIHLFDADLFVQHNAFRAPGAASLEDLNKRLSKVAYYSGVYGKMRRGIVPHEVYIDEETIEALVDFDFVFICVDRPAIKKLIFDKLEDQNVPFIDTGMELELIEETSTLIGTCRVTHSDDKKHDHINRYVSTQDAQNDDIYDSNVQVADMNAINASLAVIRWKKFCGFYQDMYEEHQTTYTLNTHQLSREETKYKESA